MKLAFWHRLLPRSKIATLGDFNNNLGDHTPYLDITGLTTSRKPKFDLCNSTHQLVSDVFSFPSTDLDHVAILRRTAEPGLRPFGRPEPPVLPIQLRAASVRACDALTSIIRLRRPFARGLRRLERLQCRLWRRTWRGRAHGRAGRPEDRVASRIFDRGLRWRAVAPRRAGCELWAHPNQGMLSLPSTSMPRWHQLTVGPPASQTLAVLNPFSRIDQHLMDDNDLAGPLFFFFLYGTFLLLSGRVHFGFIYGLALFGSISLHLILSLMAPASDPSDSPSAPSSAAPTYAPDVTAISGGPTGSASSTLTFARSASVLGYCILPLLATSLVGIVMPMDTPLGIVLTTAAIMWCTWSASGIFCAVGCMKAMRGLVAYPLALFYVGFGIMGVFSSRGSGSFARDAVPPIP